MRKFDFFLLLLTALCFAIFILKPLICNGQDYYNDFSNDFDYQVSRDYENSINSNSINHFTDENSPSAKYYDSVRKMKERKIVNEIYRRQKYEYHPYSPNKKQHRQITKTND